MMRSGLRLWEQSAPRWLIGHTERVISALGHPRLLKSVMDRGMVPMVLVASDRRHVEANRPACLALRLCLGDLRRLRIDDLTPPQRLPALTAAWCRLTDAGVAAGSHVVAGPDGGRLEVTYHALRAVLPGVHLIAFAPSTWPKDELTGDADAGVPRLTCQLTRRELEVLELAAAGCNGPMLARRLVLSPATVRTHFENIYAKLGVRDRAAAVAAAFRLGLIS